MEITGCPQHCPPTTVLCARIELLVPRLSNRGNIDGGFQDQKHDDPKTVSYFGIYRGKLYNTESFTQVVAF